MGLKTFLFWNTYWGRHGERFTHRSPKRNIRVCIVNCGWNIRVCLAFNVWVIYQINTLEHSILSFFLILESLNEIWASFDIFALRYYNKRQGRKLRPVWRQNTLWKRVKFVHKNSIYSQYFSLNSQFMACSFSLCSPMEYTFSFHWAC